jgi:hypothetical protein
VARGGRRNPGPGKKLGRPRIHPETLEIPNKGFAMRVLGMIGKEDWTKITRDSAKNAEEYALALLVCNDRRIESENFNKLLDRAFGKPAQPIRHTGPDDGEPMRLIMMDIGSS